MKFWEENGRKAQKVTWEVIFNDMVRSTLLQGRHLAEILASANKCALLAFDTTFGQIEKWVEKILRGPLEESMKLSEEEI